MTYPQQPQGGEPYPGFGNTHAGQQPHGGPPTQPQHGGASGVGWSMLRNGGMPPPAPGLSTQQQASYHNAQRVVRAKFRRLVVLLAVVVVGVSIAVIKAIWS